MSNIIILLFVLLVTGYSIEKSNFSWKKRSNGEVLKTISFIFLMVLLVLIPLIRMCISGNIMAFRATKQTISNSRMKSELERATIQKEIIEKNSWLAQVKYYDKVFFDIYIPDDVHKLQPIK